MGRAVTSQLWPTAIECNGTNGGYAIDCIQRFFEKLSWQDPARFLLLRYEDMVADAPRELMKIIAFLGKTASAQQIAQAVERSSAGQMRKLERAQTDQCELTKGSRKDLSFVRAAGSGGWRSELPTPMVEKIEAAWGPVMRTLGYELSTQPPSPEAGDRESFGVLTTPQ